MSKKGNFSIKVKNISKTFFVPMEKRRSVKSYFLNPFSKVEKRKFDALKNVSFRVKKGEFWGIIGRNGSGKSTLLKLIAGIYVPNEGKIYVRGNIVPFLELGIGFNPELSGRENIFLNGTILGMSKKFLVSKFDEIVDFAEVRDFIDMPLKNYSSGMQVRLAFSIAIQAEGDIFLLDEVLAVGDTNFQQKCLEEINRLRLAGKTIILVTHDLGVLQKYCDRAILLRKGKISTMGETDKVREVYIRQNMSDEERRIYEEEKRRQEREKKEEKRRKEEKELREKMRVAEITKVEFLDKKGRSKKVFRTGDDLTVRVYFDIKKRKEEVNFGVALFGHGNFYILGVNTILDKIDTRKSFKRGFFQVTYKNIPLKTNFYYVTVAIFGKNDNIIYDLVEQSPNFKVYSVTENQGIVEMDYKWN